MYYDYIIVGCGLAGLAFAEKLRQTGKSFMVFDDGSQQASKVAGGLYNPVMLKRFTLAWKADLQTDLARVQYEDIEKRLGLKFDYKMPVRRLIHSVEEQNNWFHASDDPILKRFMSNDLNHLEYIGFDNKYGLGEVSDSGRIDTRTLLNVYKKELIRENRLTEKPFDYERVILDENEIHYENFRCGDIVFCDGFGLKKNPYFKDLPLRGTKGELIKISCPDLNIDFILKSSVFLIPVEDNVYLAGSTYNRIDKTNQPTDEGRQELVRKLDKLLNVNYNIIDHYAGVRPTVSDRRPLLGRHPEHKNLSVLNGLGSRGVLIAPYVAQLLFDHLEKGQPLPEELDIRRFSGN